MWPRRNLGWYVGASGFEGVMLVAAVDVEETVEVVDAVEPVESVLAFRRRRKGIEGSRKVGKTEAGEVEW